MKLDHHVVINDKRKPNELKHNQLANNLTEHGWKLNKQTRTFLRNVLSWPPRSSTACTNCAWRAVVHLILGALELLFPPPLPPFPDLVVPPDNASDELFLNLWIWLGWCSLCCSCWMSHWPSCCARATVFSTSPRHSVCLEKNMSVSWFAWPPPLLLASSGGDGGLIWSDRSGAAAVVSIASCCWTSKLATEPCRLFLLEEKKWILVIRSWVAYDIWLFLYRGCVCCACGWGGR